MGCQKISPDRKKLGYLYGIAITLVGLGVLEHALFSVALKGYFVATEPNLFIIWLEIIVMFIPVPYLLKIFSLYWQKYWRGDAA
jgi:hypothetical protein